MYIDLPCQCGTGRCSAALCRGCSSAAAADAAVDAVELESVYAGLQVMMMMIIGSAAAVVVVATSASSSSSSRRWCHTNTTITRTGLTIRGEAYLRKAGALFSYA